MVQQHRHSPVPVAGAFFASDWGQHLRTCAKGMGRGGVGQDGPVRKQYHFWPARHGGGFDAWDVHRLIESSRELPVEAVPLDSIAEIDTAYWFDGSAEAPTVRKVVEHTELILEADSAYPIILGSDGRVMDGMHRVARALMAGRSHIDAVRFPAPIEADYRNCHPHDLPY